ncbi:MAG: cell division protein ZipA C-terminal FtsZ-binding domain-containing protein [Burkholderiales bacterium]
MSDLQLSLLGIGILVVAAIVLFNWLQEKNYRRNSESAFRGQFQDVLLQPQNAAPAAERERVEPRLGGIDIAETASPALSQSGFMDAAFDPAIACVAEISRAQPFSQEETRALIKLELGRKLAYQGYHQKSQVWEKLVENSGPYSRFKISLQLADRSGFVNQAQLAMFCGQLEGFAEHTAAELMLPDRGAAMEQAVELDEFCAAVDISIGLNVVAQGEQAFTGTKLRALCEAAGLKLMGDGAFHSLNEQGESLFVLSNHETAPFAAEQIKNLSTPGVTLLLDVPRVAAGLRAFDQMLSCGKQLAANLNGVLVDDNRVALNDAGVEKIREQLRTIYKLMDASNISAGSARALRLFS